MNVLIPMAGQGSRFSEAGYTQPKPFLTLGDRFMIERVIENLSNYGDRVILLYRADHFSYLKQVKALYPNVELVMVDERREGAAYHALFARHLIDNDTPLLIGNSDQWVDYDRRDWKKWLAEVDGGCMTFKDTNPKWSFCRTDETGRIVEVAEKNPISDNANVGVYYFKRGSDFVRAAGQMMAKNIRVNGEFYVAPVFNELLDLDLRCFNVTKMYGLGTPEDYEWNRPIVESKL